MIDYHIIMIFVLLLCHILRITQSDFLEDLEVI